MTSTLTDYLVSSPFATILLAYALITFSVRIYNVFLHPNARFPGPWYRAAFAFPFHLEQLQGVSPQNIHKMHQKYGPVVRIAPDNLSFDRSKAWKDIYGFRQDRSQIPKDYKRFLDMPDYLPLFASGDADHSRLRKLVAHAFSETALREQEPLVQGYITSLIDQLKSQTDSQSASKIDLNKWLDLLSFDLMSDLTFGESFNGVKTGKVDPYIDKLFLGCYMTPALLMAWDYTPVKWAFSLMSKMPSVKAGQEGDAVAHRSKVERRKALKDDAKKDFMTYILRYNDEKGATDGEILGLTTVFMAAGGEEPSSFMAGVLFYLLKNTKTLETAEAEVRQAFATAEDINQSSIGKLTYLNAVINETFRIRPPGAGHFTRRTLRTEIIDGYTVPAGTSIEVSAYAANHDPENFVDPETFAPERWLPDAPTKFGNDDQAALQPFSVGPRSCLGKNLANLEIRSTLARLLWTFDMKLSEDCQNWDMRQKFITVWHRPPLNVMMKQRQLG